MVQFMTTAKNTIFDQIDFFIQYTDCLFLSHVSQDEQAMYLYTLENEGFIVVLVNCKPLANGGVTCVNPKSESVWEIVHVQKT